MSKHELKNFIVRKEMVNTHISLVQKILEQLWKENTGGVKYCVYQMEDNLFIHIECFENERAKKDFESLESVAAFYKNLNLRVNEQPITNEIVIIEDHHL